MLQLSTTAPEHIQGRPTLPRHHGGRDSRLSLSLRLYTPEIMERVFITQRLAYMLDSLVRVSRRVKGNVERQHLVPIWVTHAKRQRWSSDWGSPGSKPVRADSIHCRHAPSARPDAEAPQVVKISSVSGSAVGPDGTTRARRQWTQSAASPTACLSSHLGTP